MIYYENAKYYLNILRDIKVYKFSVGVDRAYSKALLNDIRKKFLSDEIAWMGLDNLLHFCPIEDAYVEIIERECQQEVEFFRKGFKHWLSNGKYTV